MSELHPALQPPPAILLAPNPALTRGALRVEAVTDEVIATVDTLQRLLVARRAVSLSAPQIGRGLRLFVVAETMVAPGAPTVFINPVLTHAGPHKARRLETCFSVPQGVKVNRATLVRVQARGLDGAVFELEAGDAPEAIGPEYRGFLARVVQHEIDHLNGILMTRRRS